MSDDRHELELARLNTVANSEVKFSFEQDDRELDIETYPFDDPQQIATFWTNGDYRKGSPGNGAWVFGKQFWHLEELALERGVRFKRKDNGEPAITKGAGEVMSFYLAEVYAKPDTWRSDQEVAWGEQWVKLYHDAWALAEQEFHRYVSRGVPTPDLMDAYRKAEQVIIPKVQAKLDEIPEARFRIQISDNGEDVEIDRYLNAESEMWIRPARMKARKRAVTIAINMVAGAQRSGDWFVNMIVGVTVIGNYLVKHGYEVQLLCVRLPLFFEEDTEDDDYWRPEKHSVGYINGFTFPMVKFGQRFDPIRILTWGHQAVVRYFGFGWCHEIFGNDETVRGKVVASKGGAGRECQLTGDTPAKLGIDWLVTALTGNGDNMAQQLVTQVGPVLGGLWKAGSKAN